MVGPLRPYLVAIGAAIVVLGGAAVFSGVLNFPHTTTITDVEPAVTFPVGAHSAAVFTVQVVNASASMVISFTSGLPVTAVLSTCIPVTSGCEVAVALDTKGQAFDVSRPLPHYFLNLSNSGSAATDVRVSVQFGTVTTGGLPFWEEMVGLGGGAILVIGVGIGVFLGLFLQGNPYAPGGDIENPERSEGGIPLDEETPSEGK